MTADDQQPDGGPASESTVEFDELGAMQWIAAGGFGDVYRLPSFAFSGRPAPLAFKKFKQPLRPAELNNLMGLTAYRHGLGITEVALLDQLTTWPLRLVTKDGLIHGYLMRLLDDSLFQRIQFGSVDQIQPRAASWLLGHSAAAARVGVEVPEPGGSPERLVLCAKLAQVFALLHHDGLVYGDLSATQVVFALEPEPRIVLIDCDSAKTPALNEHRQAHQPAWLPPEGTSALQTPETDCFKLSLFIIRCLADGPRSSLTRDPDRVNGALDAEGHALLTLGLSDNPRLRPKAAQLHDYLTTRTAAPPPVALSRPVRVPSAFDVVVVPYSDGDYV